jgi:predicted nucleic acid-binding protein
MKRTVLDTNVLISYWRTHDLSKKSAAEVRCAAEKLIGRYDANVITTPVYIECVSGVRTGDELKLMRAFLKMFLVIDGWKISDADWKNACDRAERVPRDGNPRQLGDCLIRAIADRLNYDVQTYDQRFPQ